jgi:uncharacterized membrane protein YeaQ/YmgE (transglycosylase-associated protein family)
LVGKTLPFVGTGAEYTPAIGHVGAFIAAWLAKPRNIIMFKRISALAIIVVVIAAAAVAY